MENYRKAKLEIDSYNGPITIDGWAADNTHWNGWSYVLMDKKNADFLADQLVDVIVYDEKRDAFVEVFDPNQHESKDDVDKWFGFYSAELDARVYSIGSASWTWTHEILKSEFNNMHNALKEFLQKADELSANWCNEYPTISKDFKYPNYLPSFDEFVEDMRLMLLKEDSVELKEWRKTIQ